MKPTADVILNVYDASSNNSWTYYFGWGKFHSGIEIYGTEYMYQTHDGIVKISPRSGGIKGKTSFRSSITLGETHKSRQEIQNIIDSLDDIFSAEAYEPFSQNSNHFADRVAGRLCHTTIPQWVNLSADLAAFAFFYPKLQIASIVEKESD